MGIEKNIFGIKKKIDFFSKEKVTLVVVTKKRNPSLVNELLHFGVKDIAESYVDEALIKFPFFDEEVKKHFIGPMQSNKVRKIVENFDLIQSVDRLKVVRLINNFSLKFRKIMPILIQVNISGEKTKSGIGLEKVEEFLEEISEFKNIKIIGLMSIGSVGSREEFRKMKILFDSLKEKGYFMKILSMGMSEDYLMAIEEGSNMVRIGRGIFE